MTAISANSPMDYFINLGKECKAKLNTEGPKHVSHNEARILQKTDSSTREVAKKVFASIGITITNFALSITLGLLKLANLNPSFITLGRSITNALFDKNMKLSRYAYAPLNRWAQELSIENQKTIVLAENCLRACNERGILDVLKAYGKIVLDLAKVIVAPASSFLNITSIMFGALSYKAYEKGISGSGKSNKCLKIAGTCGLTFTAFLVTLNKGISYGTYDGLKGLSSDLFASLRMQPSQSGSATSAHEEL
jgi:hypothetical protein